MLVSEFDFDLPVECVAQSPACPRESAKLLVVSDRMRDLTVLDLPDLLCAGDVLVFNDTKVIPARLFGVQGGKKIEILLHKHVMGGRWLVFAKPAKKLKFGDRIDFGADFYAVVREREDCFVVVDFNVEGEDFFSQLATYGETPLPPYINEERGDVQDEQSYQTVYAKNAGAVAAPTAGLHFTEDLLAQLEIKGVICVFTTLHVGAGTFLPVKVEDTKDHKMHSEYGILSGEVANRINEAKRAGGRIIAVGTTSLRLLESVAVADGVLQEFEGETDIFITPGYDFKVVDALLTNFHLPKSTLFMLVCAFAGTRKMRDAYSYAIANKYRFYSYGDACFLLRSKELG